MKGDTVIITPVFAKALMLEQFLEHVYKNPPGVPHYILGNHYPVNEAANNDRIRCLTKDYGCHFIDSYSDIGLHRSLNNATAQMDLDYGDIIIGVDCDERPEPGFVDHLQRVMRADSSIAVAALTFGHITNLFNASGMKAQEIGGARCWVHPGVEMFSVAAFNWTFIESIGGFSQPNQYYGGIELYLHSKWSMQKRKLVYLLDTRSDEAIVDRSNPKLFDAVYGSWKIAHAHKGFVGSFKDYLAINNPEMLI